MNLTDQKQFSLLCVADRNCSCPYISILQCFFFQHINSVTAMLIIYVLYYVCLSLFSNTYKLSVHEKCYMRLGDTLDLVTLKIILS